MHLGLVYRSLSVSSNSTCIKQTLPCICGRSISWSSPRGADFCFVLMQRPGTWRFHFSGPGEDNLFLPCPGKVSRGKKGSGTVFLQREMDFTFISFPVTLDNRGFAALLRVAEVFVFCERWSREVQGVFYLNPSRSYSPSVGLHHWRESSLLSCSAPNLSWEHSGSPGEKSGCVSMNHPMSGAPGYSKFTY